MNPVEILNYGRHAAECLAFSIGTTSGPDNCDYAILEGYGDCPDRINDQDDLPTRGKHRERADIAPGMVYYQSWRKNFVRAYQIEGEPRGLCGVELL